LLGGFDEQNALNHVSPGSTVYISIRKIFIIGIDIILIISRIYS